MKISEYVRREKEQERARPSLQPRLDQLVASVMAENAATGGRKYPTVDSMYDEVIKRAEAEERSGSSSEA